MYLFLNVYSLLCRVLDTQSHLGLSVSHLMWPKSLILQIEKSKQLINCQLLFIVWAVPYHSAYIWTTEYINYIYMTVYG